MTIGITFLVKDHDKVKSIPWGVIEPFRQRALANHGMTLERLYALGGLSVSDLAKVLSDKESGASISDEDARKLVQKHLGEKDQES